MLDKPREAIEQRRDAQSDDDRDNDFDVKVEVRAGLRSVHVDDGP
jgi:hypothetical protein